MRSRPELFSLWRQGHREWALFNLFGQPILATLAAWIGLLLGAPGG